MATTTVNETYEGLVTREVSNTTVNWLSDVRNGTTGTTVETHTSDISRGVPGISYESGKTGQTGGCSRAFFFFDTSGVAGTITAATLKIFGALTTNSVDTILVKATAWGGSGGSSTLVSGDYDSIDFNTPYSAANLSWTNNAYNDYTLGTTAIIDMNANGYLNVAVITEDNDYNGVAPSLGTSYNVGIRYAYATNPNKLEITYTPFTIASISGTAFGSISSVNEIATANIANINGV